MRKFKTVHHYCGANLSDRPGIDEVLNELAKTHTIMSVNCVSSEFVKDYAGSNHGHGGAYRQHYFIVAYEEV